MVFRSKYNMCFDLEVAPMALTPDLTSASTGAYSNSPSSWVTPAAEWFGSMLVVMFYLY